MLVADPPPFEILFKPRLCCAPPSTLHFFFFFRISCHFRVLVTRTDRVRMEVCSFMNFNVKESPRPPVEELEKVAINSATGCTCVRT